MLRARIVVALSIPFGFVAGHLVGYGFGHLDPGERAIAETGHGYLASLSSAAVPLLLLSLVLAVVAGARNRPLRPRVASTALQLGGVFAVVELIEHLSAGWPIQHVVTEPSLWLGLMTQVVVAVAVVAVLRVLVRVGAELGASPAVFGAGRTPVAPGPVLATVRAIALTPIRRRGPPASVAVH